MVASLLGVRQRLAGGVVGDLADLPSEGVLLTTRNSIYLQLWMPLSPYQRFVLVISPKEARCKETLKAEDVDKICTPI